MDNTPPSFDKTLANYKITPETLWVGFFLFAPEGTQRPKRELNYLFSLAAPGEEGVAMIKKVNDDPDYLGCFSLAGLEHLLQLANEQSKEPGQSFVDSCSSLLRIKRNFMIVVQEEGREFMVYAKAFTLEGAMKKVREAHPNGTIGFGGDLTDLEDLVTEMRGICQQQDFSKVDRDRRDRVEGWDAYDLLLAKRHPDMKAAIEAYSDYEESHEEVDQG